SCATLSMPTRSRGKEGSRVAGTAARAKHLHTAPPDHRQLQSVRSGDCSGDRAVPLRSVGAPVSCLVRVGVEFGATPDELSLPTAVVRRTLRTWRRRTTRLPR